MTEPPEPRRPEEGGGEEPSEIPELNEILDSEWFGEMEDDMLLDRIGQGDDDRSVKTERHQSTVSGRGSELGFGRVSDDAATII